MPATLLIAAHGTRSPDGTATTRALVDAIAAARPSVPVRLCFLDVAEPSLPVALDELAGTNVVIVPLLLSAGYHVLSDIPAAVAGRRGVRVAAHLGPDPAVLDAVADRLAQAIASAPASAGSGTSAPGTTVLAAVASSRPSARAEVQQAVDALAHRIRRPVTALPLSGDLPAAVAALPAPLSVALYLLAPGGFLDDLRGAVAGRGVVAEPIGAHPALVGLVWRRYDAAGRAEPAR